ncbi:MAG: RDD family protein [Rhabdochlamydiaceae bacterium]|nr:RDD family protein [Rhabdochlamydiaceae bacterium]
MFLFLRRFLARLFDYGLFYFVTIFITLIFPIEFESQIFLLWSLVVPLVWAPFEALLLYKWQTTPGKKLFGLSLPSLSWSESCKRAFFFKRSKDLLVKSIGVKRYLIALMLACSAGSALFLGEDISEAAVHYEQSITGSGWIQYVSDNGKFQVQFPKKPVEQEPQQFEVPNGDPLEVSEFKAHKEAEFSVSYLDLPKKWKLFSSNTLLKGAMKVVHEHMPGAKITDKKLVKHKNYPAMDFKMQEGEKEIEGRLILVGNTLYKLWVVYTPNTPREQQHEIFLNSFELK